MLLTHYIYLFSRVVLADGPIFVQLMSATASAQGVQEATLYEGLLDQWWQRVSSGLWRFRHLTYFSPFASSITCQSRDIGSSRQWVSHRWFLPDGQRCFRGCPQKYSICGWMCLVRFARPAKISRMSRMSVYPCFFSYFRLTTYKAARYHR